jgi:Holliday junction resolvasome RuvABC endonuclease subunit
LGCAKRLCVELGIPFAEIPPTTLKLIVAGNGWATKEEVALRISEHLKVPYESIVSVTYYTQGLKKGQIKSYIMDGSDALALAMTLPVYLKRPGIKLDYKGRK